jgi:hypothetical protein
MNNITQDIYYSSKFKKDFDSNYNFNILLDNNIDVSDNYKIKFKLINFSMMNSMLNISQTHQNNQIKIKYLTVDYIITIDDGSYTATSLRNAINNKLFALNIALAFNYDKLTNKYFILTSENIVSGDVIFYPLNMSKVLGFKNASYDVIYPNEYFSETFVNLLPYDKIVITTDLTFECNSQNNFNKEYSAYSGTGDIITWISRDIVPFSTINYTNKNNDEILLANKNLKSINISLMNEFNEYILDAPDSCIHFQLIIYESTNWNKKFYKLIYDIYYSLLSLYFKKK